MYSSTVYRDFVILDFATVFSKAFISPQGGIDLAVPFCQTLVLMVLVQTGFLHE